MALKVTKKEMLEILLKYGLSPIESDRTFNSKEEFEEAIRSILEYAD